MPPTPSFASLQYGLPYTIWQAIMKIFNKRRYSLIMLKVPFNSNQPTRDGMILGYSRESFGCSNSQSSLRLTSCSGHRVKIDGGGVVGVGPPLENR